jgi:hypothetical protein
MRFGAADVKRSPSYFVYLANLVRTALPLRDGSSLTRAAPVTTMSLARDA